MFKNCNGFFLFLLGKKRKHYKSVVNIIQIACQISMQLMDKFIENEENLRNVLFYTLSFVNMKGIFTIPD